MADITFEEIVKAVEKLTPAQRLLLRETLEDSPLELTREALLAEFEARRAAGAFEHVESMRNLYAKPQAADITDAQLLADIHQAATEWEQELDEFFGDES